jgi:hypothetical protein
MLEWYQRCSPYVSKCKSITTKSCRENLPPHTYTNFSQQYFTAAETGPGWAANLKIVKINELAVKTRTVILRRLIMCGIYTVKTHIMFYTFKVYNNIMTEFCDSDIEYNYVDFNK